MAGQDTRPKLVDEFLVVWPEMERIAKEYGLTLVMKKNFRQYFDDLCSPEPVSLQGQPAQAKPDDRDRRGRDQPRDFTAPPEAHFRQRNADTFQRMVTNQIKNDPNQDQNKVD